MRFDLSNQASCIHNQMKSTDIINHPHIDYGDQFARAPAKVEDRSGSSQRSKNNRIFKQIFTDAGRFQGQPIGEEDHCQLLPNSHPKANNDKEQRPARIDLIETQRNFAKDKRNLVNIKTHTTNRETPWKH